jgi:DNA polymerase V
MDTLQQFTPSMEIYSIDEAFLSLHGIRHAELHSFAQLIRTTIRRCTGIPVSIGIGQTKTLAKIANKIVKETPEAHGVFSTLCHPATDTLLDSIEVSDVWGIGRQYTKFLRKHNIFTARQLKYSSKEWTRRHLTVVGLRTVLELRGISCIPLSEAPPSKKSIASSRSFSKSVEHLVELVEAVSDYVSRAAEKLREQKSVASCLQVYLTTNKFKNKPQYTNRSTLQLPMPTAYTPELTQHAIKCLRGIFRQGYQYHKVGVFLTGIMPEQHLQAHLFSKRDCNSGCKRRLMEAVDSINKRWGRQTAQFAVSGVVKSWKMKQMFKSPCYTTRWSDIPVVKA